MPLPLRAGALAVTATLLACAHAEAPPSVAHTPERATARAVLVVSAGKPSSTSAEPPREIAAALASAPVTTLQARAEIEATLRSDEVRRRVSEEIAFDVGASDLTVQEEGGTIVLTARADHPQAALARCAAWLRVATRASSPPRDAAVEWLDAERARVTQRLVELETSLRRLPARPRRSGPTSRDELLVGARLHAMELRALAQSASASDEDFPLLRAMRLEAERATRAAEELRAHGARDEDPELEEAKARRDSLLRRHEAQLALERLATDALVARAEAAPARADGEQLEARWQLERLDAAGHDLAVAVTSAEAVPLQVLAMEDTVERAELAAISLTLGERHPRRMAVEARLEEIARALEGLRDEVHEDLQIATMAGLPGLARPEDRRGDEVLQRAAELAALLARIASWRDALAARAPVVTVLRACAPP